VVDAPIDFSIDIEQKLKDETSFKIIGHKLEFVGICPDCQKN
jgi:Fe2+ or Zn2+ uptake regulation protein